MGASLNFAHKAPHLPHLSFSPILLGSHRSGQVVVAFQRKVLENHLRLAKGGFSQQRGAMEGTAPRRGDTGQVDHGPGNGVGCQERLCA